MSRSPEIPSGARVVREYKALRAYLEAFAGGHLNFLLIIGRAGTSKSQLIRQAIGSNEVHVIKGHSTALSVFIEVYRHCHQQIILDDAEDLYTTHQGKMLMKQLCDTDERKTLQWNTTTKVLDDLGVPRNFVTTSRVCVIQNHWHGTNEHAKAILDRAHLIYFDPTPAEVHQQVAEWFWDQEVHDFVGSKLHLLSRLTARMYVRAAELRKARLDWRSEVLAHAHEHMLLVVQEVLATFKRASEQVAEFERRTGLKKSQFYAYKKELEQNGQISFEPAAPMPLKQRDPSTKSNHEELLSAQLVGQDAA